MNKVISITSVRRCLRSSYDYFEHLQNIGILNGLSEEDQRKFRAIFQDIHETNSSDWTVNYF